jgi:hypothetical protein
MFEDLAGTSSWDSTELIPLISGPVCLVPLLNKEGGRKSTSGEQQYQLDQRED